MNRQNRSLRTVACWLAAVGTTAVAAHGPAQEKTAAAKPKVLILGDSISVGYTAQVQQLLKDEVQVHRPVQENGAAENCQGTTYGIRHIDRWLAIDNGGWDLIHFNFGLHDMKRVDPSTGKNSNHASDSRQAEPEAYERQLRQIVDRLQRSGAVLVFATTTPVPQGELRPYRDPADPPVYNDVALKVMSQYGIRVNDLFEFAEPRLSEIQKPADVHFTQHGSAQLAEQVARHIRAALSERR